MLRPRLFGSTYLLLLTGLLFSGLLVGCDATGTDPAERGRFTASFRGAADADFEGEAVHESVEGEALLGVFTNFGVRLTDRDWSTTKRGIYFVRRDPSKLAVGTYALLDLRSDDPARLDPQRAWAYVGGVGEDFAYSRGGELRIEEARGDRLAGTFRFPAAPLSDTTGADVITVEGTFESVRR